MASLDGQIQHLLASPPALLQRERYAKVRHAGECVLCGAGRGQGTSPSHLGPAGRAAQCLACRRPAAALLPPPLLASPTSVLLTCLLWPLQLTAGMGLEVRLDAGGGKGKGVFATKVGGWGAAGSPSRGTGQIAPASTVSLCSFRLVFCLPKQLPRDRLGNLLHPPSCRALVAGRCCSGSRRWPSCSTPPTARRPGCAPAASASSEALSSRWRG